VVVIDGPADPSAPSVADVVHADRATWDELLTRSDVPAGAAFQADVTIGQGVEVPLLAFDEQVPTSTLLLRIVEQDGVAFVQIETAGAVLDPEAVLWKVDIEGRGGGLSTAAVGPVTGYRLGDAPFTGEVNLEITAIDGGDFTLQTTGPVRLVVS
nr:hypothetical protein [Ilumatobacteraceae bacterium]